MPRAVAQALVQQLARDPVPDRRVELRERAVESAVPQVAHDARVAGWDRGRPAGVVAEQVERAPLGEAFALMRWISKFFSSPCANPACPMDRRCSVKYSDSRNIEPSAYTPCALKYAYAPGSISTT
jgi:hypothetical protein